MPRPMKGLNNLKSTYTLDLAGHMPKELGTKDGALTWTRKNFHYAIDGVRMEYECSMDGRTYVVEIRPCALETLTAKQGIEDTQAALNATIKKGKNDGDSND